MDDPNLPKLTRAQRRALNRADWARREASRRKKMGLEGRDSRARPARDRAQAHAGARDEPPAQWLLE